MEIYLFEIIKISRFEQVPVLLRCLRTVPSKSTISRGYRCQRLDIYLGSEDIFYNDEVWYEGGHMFWGLIPACPNLKILIARVIGAPTTPLVVPHLTHIALWKTIATHYSHTLRRLELYGFSIRMDRVEMMLRYLSNLEACRIAHVKPFDPLENVYDEEEPKEREIPLRFRLICLVDSWDETEVLRWFDSDIAAEFQESRAKACWPQFNSSSPYTLPKLHTLHLHNLYMERIGTFSFPRLQHLDITCSKEYDNLDLLNGISPPTLTHLMFGGANVSIAQIADCFPHLRYLGLNIETGNYPSTPTFHVPHRNLEIVELISWNFDDTHTPRMTCDIIDAVRIEKLPSLRVIKVTRSGERDDTILPFKDARSDNSLYDNGPAALFVNSVLPLDKPL
ncbi:hypothetical protein H0H93_004160 [Arthromyces matolae]|nr:hypothetical protein H0H93_004160 [Arthromyces matolae]